MQNEPTAQSGRENKPKQTQRKTRVAVRYPRFRPIPACAGYETNPFGEVRSLISTAPAVTTPLHDEPLTADHEPPTTNQTHGPH
jgi:hypothetical protein